MLYSVMLEVFSNLNDSMFSMISMIQHPPVLLLNVVFRIPATPWPDLQMSPVPPADNNRRQSVQGQRSCHVGAQQAQVLPISNLTPNGLIFLSLNRG